MKKILILLMCIICAFPVLTSCNGNKDNPNGDIVTNEKEILLYDFENYDRNFQLMHVMTFFGAVKINSDKNFVESGNISAQLRPLGHTSTMMNNTFTAVQSESLLFIPLTSEKFDFNYSDLTKLELIHFSVFNGEKTEKNLYFNLIFDGMAEKVIPHSTYVLKPGWNDVYYRIDHNFINMLYDLKHCYGMGLSFDRVGSRYIEDAPYFYLDNIYLKKAKNEPVIEDIIELKENEICDFEEIYQQYIVGTRAYDKAICPIPQVINAKEFGFNAPSGNNILKVFSPKKESIQGDIYEGVFFDKNLLDRIDFKSLSEDDEICFDVYVDGDEAIFMPIEFVESNSNLGGSISLMVNPKTWSTIRISVKTINSLNNFKKNKWTDYPKEIRVLLQESFEDQTLYLDDFRIERGDK